MIDNPAEYQRMFEVEQKLWWYQSLHKRISKHIKTHFKGVDAHLKILDAACGTGGLLQKLREQGYHHCSGFDYSVHAVNLSGKRGLDVERGDLRHPELYRPGTTYDVICCSDALYFLNDQEIISTLEVFRQRLNPGGILIVNIHAFEVFSGTHDVAVGSSRRFTLKDFKTYAAQSGLKIDYSTYWPFLLSLPILVVRTWQRRKMKQKAITSRQSDVEYPGDLINGLLGGVMRLEEILLPSAPFGSSLFLVMKPHLYGKER